MVRKRADCRVRHGGADMVTADTLSMRVKVNGRNRSRPFFSYP
jgi:hypothetical protein